MIVSVDSKDRLDHIGGPGHIPTVGGRPEGEAVRGLSFNGDVEVPKDALDAVPIEWDPDQGVQHGPIEADGRWLGQSVPFEGLYSTVDFGAGVLAEQGDGRLQGRPRGLRIHTALEAEGGIGRQGVPLGALPDGHGLEPGTLEEDAGGGLRDPGVLTAIHAGEAHGPLGIGNHEVGRGQGEGLAVQRGEGLSFGGAAHPHGVPADAVGVEGMEGLAEVVQHVVGDVHHVVLGLDANGPQAALHPFRSGSDLHVAEGDAQITGRAIGGLHIKRYRTGPDGQLRRGQAAECGQRRGSTLSSIPSPGGAQVAGDPPVSHGVGPIRRQADFNAVVRSESEDLGRPSADRGRRIQHEDAIVVLSDAEFVLGTDHAFGDFPADLAPLDFERITLHRVTGGADGGDDDLLSRRHIRGATDDVERSVPAHIHGGHSEPVGIRVLAAGQDLPHDHAAETPRHSGHLLEAFHLQTAGREDVAQVLGGPGGSRVEGEPGGEPIQGNLHDAGSGWVGREFSPPPRAVGVVEKSKTPLLF